MQNRRRTLFVGNINPYTRARDLAYEFERFGRLVRCDIPLPKNPGARPYAFVEFQNHEDAVLAYRDLQGKKVEGYEIILDWARESQSTKGDR